MYPSTQIQYLFQINKRTQINSQLAPCIRVKVNKHHHDPTRLSVNNELNLVNAQMQIIEARVRVT